MAYDIGSDNWRAHLKTSRFWQTPGWGRAPKGHLCIQDYGDPIEFRSIKLRPLPAKAP